MHSTVYFVLRTLVRIHLANFYGLIRSMDLLFMMQSTSRIVKSVDCGVFVADEVALPPLYSVVEF